MKLLLSLDDYEEFIANLLYTNCVFNNQYKTILEFLCRSSNLFKDQKLGKALLSHFNGDYEDCYNNLGSRSSNILISMLLELEFMLMKDNKNNFVNRRMKYFKNFKIDAKKFIQKYENYDMTYTYNTCIENNYFEIFEILKVYIMINFS